MRQVRRFSFGRPGRLIMAPERGLRARAVQLPKSARMAWHSTGRREEIVLVIAGSLVVAVMDCANRMRRISLSAGEGVFLPRDTRHAVVNKSAQAASYVYVTGRA